MARQKALGADDEWEGLDCSGNEAVHGPEFARLAEDVREKVEGYARRRVGPDTGRDVGQHSLLAMLKQALRNPALIGRPAEAAAVALRAAMNLVKDIQKQEKFRSGQANALSAEWLDRLRGWAADPEALALAAELDERMDKLIEKMPPTRWLVLLHRRYGGLSAKETAESVGIEVKTVDVHLALALDDLARGLADYSSQSARVSKVANAKRPKGGDIQ